MADCERMVVEATEGLGGLDIVISNAVSQKPCPAPQDAKIATRAMSSTSFIHLLQRFRRLSPRIPSKGLSFYDSKDSIPDYVA